MSHETTRRTLGHWPRSTIRQGSLLLGFALGSLALLIGLNLWRGINHDEHQFIAAGDLIARGLRPYVDFPYFHVPLLAYLYSLLFQIFPALLLSARLFSVVWGWLTLLLLGWIVYTRLAPRLRLPAALSLMSLLLAAPLFIHTSGRAWNHDLPSFLLLLAYLAYLRADQQAANPPRRGLGLFACGLLIGLAASVRLSFALIAPAFLVAAWFVDWQRHGSSHTVWRSSLGAALWFGSGGLLGLFPIFWAARLDPAAFWFGNVDYIRLNTEYYRTLPQPPAAMDLLGKLRYCFEVMVFQPGNLLVVLVVGLAQWPARSTRAAITQPASHRFLLLLLLGLSGLAALGPTPSQWQYFYPLLPLLLLLAGEGLAVQPVAVQSSRIRWIIGAASLALLLAIPPYAPALTTLFSPPAWLPWTVHQRSQFIAHLVDEQPVLTLAPLYPLEGGAAIEPALATGPFAWRVANFVPAERRATLGLLAPADLPALWATNPPRGVLTGIESDDAADEAPLVAQAQAHGFVPVSLPNDATLWLAPQHEWGGAIRLGGHTVPRQPLVPGSTLIATFYLQNIAPLQENLNVLVRVVNVRGEELLRSEGWPWGAATSTWAPNTVWPDGHTFTIPPTAKAGVYRVEMSFYDPATLETLGETTPVAYLLIADADTGQPAAPLATFGGQIRLQARAEIAALADQVVAPGETLSFALAWQALARPTADYTRFVHVVGPDGQLIAQHDQPPQAGFYPTSAWQPGYTVHDEVHLQFPIDAPSGTYQLQVGLYDPQTGQRLSVQATNADFMLLSRVQVR